MAFDVVKDHVHRVGVGAERLHDSGRDGHGGGAFLVGRAALEKLDVNGGHGVSGFVAGAVEDVVGGVAGDVADG